MSFQIDDFRLFHADFQPQPVVEPLLNSDEHFFSIAPFPTKQLEIICIADNMHLFELGRIFERTIYGRFIYRAVWPYLTTVFLPGGHIFPLGINPPVKLIQHDIG